MKLSDLNKIFFFFIIFINFNNSFAENEIDIWKEENLNKQVKEDKKKVDKIQSPLINKNNITTRRGRKGKRVGNDVRR